ncbi:MAG: hypothetical protein UT26_C0061G0004 [Microgenomates group bacterium GW2011_GWC1_39_12]|nr:MAG: hypothetical protein UT26_C0061G0004 [Microgenomates group bacterium GW2011_GWC1_39_12]
MFDVLKTLSALIKAKPSKQGVTQPKIVSTVQKLQPKQPIQEKISKEDNKALLQAQAQMQAQAQAAIAMAQAQAREVLVEAKDQAFRLKREAEDEMRRRMDIVGKREGEVSEREKHLRDQEVVSEKKLLDIENVKRELTERLEKISRLTVEEAKTQMLAEVQEKMKMVIAKEIKDAQIKAEEESEVKAN